MKRALILVLKLAIIALLLSYVVRSLQKQSFDAARLDTLLAGWRWLVLAQFFIEGMLFLTFYRWKLLLGAQGIHYSTGEAVALGSIGFFFNQFIPGSTGGDIFKAYYVAIDHPERRAAGITTVFLDRVVGVLDLVALAGVAMAWNWRQVMSDPVLRYLAVFVAAILGGCAVGGALFFSEKVRKNPRVTAAMKWLPFQHVLWKVQAAVYVYKYHPGLVLIAVFLSILVQLSVVGMSICFAMALGGDANIGAFFFIVPLANLAMAIPTGSPGGLGQSEFAYSVLFSRVGYHDGLLLALIQRVNWYVLSLAGAFFYLRRRKRVNEARRLAREGEAGEPEGIGESASAPAPVDTEKR